MATEHPPTLLRFNSTAGRLALLASILGSGMAFLDSTAINVALPRLGEDLGAGFTEFQWILNGYMLALGALVLLGGSLGDLYGRRRVFVVGVVWFALASLACGLAPNTLVLIVFRVIQGIGAALLTPTSLAVLQAGFHPDDRGQAIGTWSGFSGLSTIIGPVLGGWLVDAVTWRAVFLLNLPLAVVTVWLALRYVPETRGSDRARPDLAGAAAITLALAGIVYALTEGVVQGWGSPLVLTGIAVGVLALIAYALLERVTEHPMIPLHTFRQRQFSGANLATLFIYFVLSGVLFLLALQLQRVVGYSALQAGLVFIPITIMLFILSPFAGRLSDRIGPRLPMTVGPIIAAIGVAMLSTIAADSTFLTGVLPAIMVLGIGLGITVAPLTSAALGALDDAQAGVASGVNNAVARIAQLLAVPLLPLLAGLSGIEEVAGEAFSAGFSQAMWIGAGLLLVGGLVAFAMVRKPGGDQGR